MEDTTPQQTGVHFTGDEYLKIGAVAAPFWERGANGDPPTLAIVMGGIGAGKTTLRRQQFAEGFVHFDFGESYNAFEKAFGEEEPRLAEYAIMGSEMIVTESIDDKTIVIEIIGDMAEFILPVIDSMKAVGYEVSVNGIECDIAEAYRRHVKAVEEDPDYNSAFHTQEPTLSFFFNDFNSGSVPPTASF
jgi:hypothetical protein